MKDLKKIISERKSVRTYDGRPLSEEHRKLLEEYAAGITNPFNVPVSFVFLDAGENGLSSPVLSGELYYVAGKVQKKPFAEVAFGYSFEKLVLYAQSLGIGTVWIGGTMKRELFEAAAEVKEGELMPCVSPLGYPAKRRSIKEVMMRKGVGADTRISADKLFFDEKWGQPLNPDAECAELLEMVRLAPSAVNKQPWRIIRLGDTWHFFEKKDKGFEREGAGDMQKIDIGIALCHFVLGLEEKGIKPEISVKDPGLEIPADAEYIVSVRIPA